jgi:hypothetical protein
MEEHRELTLEEADFISGGFDTYSGMSANTGTKTGGNASNYGDITGGNAGAGGYVNHGATYGNNTSGAGGFAYQNPFDSKMNSSNANGGAGGSITNIGAQGGNGGNGGDAIGSQGGSVNDNIVTNISIPVTMNL